MKTTIQLSDHFTYHKLLRFTFPTIVMMVFTSIYTVVDGYFVSNFAGKTAFASVNLIFPFVMVLGGMGFMIGTGGTALVSLVLGTGEREKANRYFSMMVWLTLLLGILLTVLGVVFTRPNTSLLKLTRTKIEIKPILQACANGSSELMNNISSPIISYHYGAGNAAELNCMR